MENLNDRFVYAPSCKKGKSLFDGLPIPSMEAYEILQEQGVKSIDNKMKEMLEWRKQMFGTLETEHYGFHFKELMIDTKAKVSLMLYNIDSDISSFLNDDTTQYNITKNLIETHKESTGNYAIYVTNQIEKGLGDRAFNNRVKKLLTNESRVCPDLFDYEKIDAVRSFVESYDKLKGRK